MKYQSFILVLQADVKISNRCTMMFCYNISLRYNSSRHFYVLTVCDPEICVVSDYNTNAAS